MRCKVDPQAGKPPEDEMATAGFLPGESHGQRSLAGCSPKYASGLNKSQKERGRKRRRKMIFLY